MSKKLRLTLLGLLTAACLISCGRTDPLQDRAEAAAEAEALTEATRELPDLPADCRRTSRSGVTEGDRLDTALIKTDAALTRQNQRTRRCAAWYDDVQEGFEQEPESEAPQGAE